MFINTENINNIAILSTEKPIDFGRFQHFIQKSPFVRRVAFIGKAIFDMPEFPEMIRFCAMNNICLIFGEVGTTSFENLKSLVEYQNVLFVNIHDDGSNVKTLQNLKNQFNVRFPDINIIVNIESNPQAQLSDKSYAFFNLADDMEHIFCLKLLEEPMLNYDGTLFGCWQNPDAKKNINAFDLGMERAINHKIYKKILKMLRTQKIDIKCQCARCPVFLSLIWSNKKIDICKCILNK